MNITNFIIISLQLSLFLLKHIDGKLQLIKFKHILLNKECMFYLINLNDYYMYSSNSY